MMLGTVFEARPHVVEAMRIRVEGIVQGIGFRPFVWALAKRLGLKGSVANDTSGVLIEIEGNCTSLEAFKVALRHEAPRLAAIERITAEAIPLSGRQQFEILGSEITGQHETLVCPDIATCDECLREVFDPNDRRYRFAFTNCTNCGPRFTIVCGVPYDRALTTMDSFRMCSACEREYHDPADRRFHAQPVCCPACGPRLLLVDRNGREECGDPLNRTASLLRQGNIVAIKGLGGYHLAALARDESAVATLRARKHREDKPFAMMVPDLDTARLLANIDADEAELLLSCRRPIVLLKRRTGTTLAPSICRRSQSIGLMLPYTPLHHMLCRELDEPFVLTSGNLSDEPIAFIDAEARQRLSAVADFHLTHDRAIHIRTDDSVVRSIRGRSLPIRRSRGYAPGPLTLPWKIRRPTLGCGAELKNTFCLAKGRHAFLSHHIGDLENFETFEAFIGGIDHFKSIFDIEPALVAYDLHPNYLSTRYAREVTAVALEGVQHHHAHIASCLAENAEFGPVIGVAFDGLGYGTDGTIWGGEFLIADFEKFQRAAHFEQLPMPGGTAAIRQPWRMAAAYLDAAFGDDLPKALAVIGRNRTNWKNIVNLSRSRINSPLTSSAGRLFDAVASILGIRDIVNYEGQAAIELEQMASPLEESHYPTRIDLADVITIRSTDIIRAMVEDLKYGAAIEVMAARFHNGVAQIVIDTCRVLRDRTGISVVALSGGVFQNALLLHRTLDGLERSSFRVLTHSRVPSNDGGISLGQVVVAAARQKILE